MCGGAQGIGQAGDEESAPAHRALIRRILQTGHEEMAAGTSGAGQRENPEVNAKGRVKKKAQGATRDGGVQPGIEWNYFLTFKLDLVKSEMISRANASYRQAVGLDVRSLRVLRVICNTEGITATALRQYTLIEKTLLSKLVADLIERKLVRRSIHPDDARQFQLWPTAAGKRLRTTADELGQTLETEMLSMLSAQERGELNRIVDKLVEVFRQTGDGS
jgi:MarR family transcriptional regulator, temperature-dependent positive regulator of motility